MRLRRNEKVLPPVHPNVGIYSLYRKKLRALIEEMSRSYEHWMHAAYKANEPAISQAADSIRRSWAVEQVDVVITKPARPPPGATDFSYVEETETRKTWLAMDESPAKELEKELRRLGVQWRKKFETAAPALAAWFAKSASRRSDAALRQILKDAGISVEFQMTRAMRDILNATVAGNVAMIRSIPEQYHAQVQDLVMRSVQTGRDLGTLAKELQARYGVTERRAALIAFTQNQMATSAMQRARQTELGIDEAIWLHSHAGKTVRPTHLANDGKRYKISEGFFDPDPKVRRRIWPGELIRCRCVAKPIVRGFS